MFLTPPHISSLSYFWDDSPALILLTVVKHSAMHTHAATEISDVNIVQENVRVTLSEVENKSRRRGWIVRVEAHRGRKEILWWQADAAGAIKWWPYDRASLTNVDHARMSRRVSLFYFYLYFILNPIPYLYLWISVRRCVRTATPRGFSSSATSVEFFSLSLSFSLSSPFLLFHCSRLTHQR